LGELWRCVVLAAIHMVEPYGYVIVTVGLSMLHCQDLCDSVTPKAVVVLEENSQKTATLPMENGGQE
jgi:hypothetical protein